MTPARVSDKLGASFISGVLGLILGDELLFGLLNIDLVEDIIHLGTGALLTYAGFRSEENQLRTIVGVLACYPCSPASSGSSTPLYSVSSLTPTRTPITSYT